MRNLRSRTVLWLLFLGAVTFAGRLGAQETASEAPVEKAAKPAARPPAAQAQAEASTPPKRGPRPGDVQRVFVLRHASPYDLSKVLSVFPATFSYSVPDHTRALGVSAPPAVVAAIEETVKRLDVPESASEPSANIELTGYVLEALAQPVDGARVPPELEGVVAQLKRSFSYAAYRVVDTLIARVRAGSSLSTYALAEMPQEPLGAKTRYTLKVRRTGLTAGEAGPLIRLDHLYFGAQIPVRVGGGVAGSTPAVPAAYQYTNIGVDADVDIREGQRIVVGKSGVGEAGNAIILVLSAKVAD